MRRLSFVVALLLLVVLAGCVREEFGTCVDDPTDPRCVADAGDAGVRDAGDGGRFDASDGGGDDLGDDDLGTDAGPCGLECPVTTPVCDVTSGACVECTAGDATACTGGTPVCDVATNACVECTVADATGCTGGTPVCDTATNVCVACNVDADCTSLTAPQCNSATHACAPCTGAAACAGRVGALVCDAAGGACVQCTGADRAACLGNVCDIAARTCSTSPLASAQLCESCVSDAQCQLGQVCVSMSGDSPTRVLGHYCLWLESATGPGAPSGACSTARPYIQGADRTALEAGAVRVCEPAIATCEALLDFRSPSVPCTPPLPAVANDACGATGVDDGYCQFLDAATNFCTVACSSYLDCPDPLGPSCYRCTAGLCAFTTGTESGGTCM